MNSSFHFIQPFCFYFLYFQPSSLFFEYKAITPVTASVFLPTHDKIPITCFVLSKHRTPHKNPLHSNSAFPCNNFILSLSIYLRFYFEHPLHFLPQKFFCPA